MSAVETAPATAVRLRITEIFASLQGESLADVKLRLRLARRRGAILVLTRPVLASAPDPDRLADALVEVLTRPPTTKVERGEA